MELDLIDLAIKEENNKCKRNQELSIRRYCDPMFDLHLVIENFYYNVTTKDNHDNMVKGIAKAIFKELTKYDIELVIKTAEEELRGQDGIY